MADENQDVEQDPTHYLIKWCGAILVALILSVAGYCTTETLVSPDRCTRDAQGITSTCFQHVSAVEEHLCLEAGVKMIQACAGRNPPKN